MNCASDNNHDDDDDVHDGAEAKAESTSVVSSRRIRSKAHSQGGRSEEVTLSGDPSFAGARISKQEEGEEEDKEDKEVKEVKEAKVKKARSTMERRATNNSRPIRSIVRLHSKRHASTLISSASARSLTSANASVSPGSHWAAQATANEAYNDEDSLGLGGHFCSSPPSPPLVSSQQSSSSSPVAELLTDSTSPAIKVTVRRRLRSAPLVRSGVIHQERAAHKPETSFAVASSAASPSTHSSSPTASSEAPSVAVARPIGTERSSRGCRAHSESSPQGSPAQRDLSLLQDSSGERRDRSLLQNSSASNADADRHVADSSTRSSTDGSYKAAMVEALLAIVDSSPEQNDDEPDEKADGEAEASALAGTTDRPAQRASDTDSDLDAEFSESDLPSAEVLLSLTDLLHNQEYYAEEGEEEGEKRPNEEALTGKPTDSPWGASCPFCKRPLRREACVARCGHVCCTPCWHDCAPTPQPSGRSGEIGLRSVQCPACNQPVYLNQLKKIYL